VGGLAMIGGLATGLPLGLAANVIGKGSIADAINAQAYASNVANNMGVIGAQMGLDPNDPANAAAISAAMDSVVGSPTGQAAATTGLGGTGGSAAAAASAAASAAAAAGYSDAAIGAASQAAADAAISGGNPAAAGAQAAADVDGDGIGGAGTGFNDASSATGGFGFGATGTDTGVDGSESGGGGGGGGGGKIICTKLHALGLMPTNIYEADQAFGKKLVNESPETYDGYVRWAKHVVDMMGRDDLLGKTAVFCAYHIATPWSLAMAEEMGQPVKASWFGKFLMKRGLQLCKFIGPSNKKTATA
jgi:hypothetical protein